MAANMDEAVKWLRRAAELGNQEAMLKLGTILANSNKTFSEIVNDYEVSIRENKNKITELEKNIINIKQDFSEVKKRLAILESGHNKPSNSHVDDLKPEINKPISFGDVKVGSIIKFGNYPQNSRDRKEPIEWRVLKVENGKALLISEYALDCKKYNETYENTTWEKCTLRKWLNSDFIKGAFTGDEQSRILLSDVKADKSLIYGGTPQGNDTRDKVFLLSAKEAILYFKSNSDRMCVPDNFAISNGAYRNDYGECWWWLRSLGYLSNNATNVNTFGSVHYDGYYVNHDNYAVRPALWINL